MKSTLTFFAIIFNLFLLQSLAYSQQEDGLKQIELPIPRSPEANAIIKHIDIPVNHYSGLPSVNEQLMSYGIRDLGENISLDYHAGGHKVNEIAGSSGLGWKLNAGGMITRRVVGRQDDDHGHGFLDARNNYTYEELIEGHNNLDRDLTEEIANNCVDAEPDEFYFSFAGYNGKMVFDWDNHDPQIICEQDIKILDWSRGLNGIIKSWILVDPNGNKYTFDNTAVETSVTITYQSGTPAPGECYDSVFPFMTTGWHLAKIESGTDHLNKIFFDYEMYTIEQDWQTVDSKLISTNSNTFCGGLSSNGQVTYNSNQTTINGHRITKIRNSINDDELRFEYSTEDRNDTEGLLSYTNFQQLDKISFYKNDSEVISSVSFNYDYQGRLLLQSIQKNGGVDEEGEDIVCNPPTVFNYNLGDLPPIDSKAVDYWGFYNGQTTNSKYLPSFVQLHWTNRYIIHNGANRTPSLFETKAAVLKDITYPTGGIVSLDYELHDYGFIQSAPLSAISQYEILARNVAIESIGNAPPDYQLVINSTPFTIQDNGTILVRLDFSGITYSEDDFPIPYELPRVEIRDEDGNLVYSDDLDLIYGIEQARFENLSMTAGNYTLRTSAKTHSSADLPDIARASLYYEELDYNDPVVEKQMGGLRIKSITYDNSVINENGENNIVTKEFLYEMEPDEEGETISSGVILQEPIYARRNQYLKVDHECEDPSRICHVHVCENTIMSASSVSIIGSTKGNPIGYRKVTERIAGNGKTDYSFTSPFDYPTKHNNDAPYGFPSSQDHKTGLLLTKNIYSETGSVSSDTYEYDFIDLEIDQISIKYHIPKPGLGTPNFIIDFWFLISFTDLFAFWNEPRRYGISRIKKHTFMLDGVETITNYEYNNPEHLNVTAQELTNSEGKVHRTEYKYAHEKEIEGGHPVAGLMVDSNMVATPLEVRKYVNGQLQGGSINEYGNFGGMLLLKKQYQILHDEPNNPLLRGTIDYYTSTSNSTDGDAVRGLPSSYQKNFFPAPQTFTYHQDEKEGLLKSQTYQQRKTTYDYYTDHRYRQLKKITGIDGLSSLFDYDHCQRLTLSATRNGQLINTYSYQYTLVGNPDKPNHIIHTNEDGIVNFQYLDGLGRPLQTVAQAYTPGGKGDDGSIKDLVTGGVKYDPAGRPYKQYLPYKSANSDGSYVEIPEGHHHNEALFENSPLNRDKGMIYAGFGATTISYGSGGSDVINYSGGGTYPGSSLYRKDVNIGNGNVTTTFTDKIGQLILTRKYVDVNGVGTDVNTYNVYDDRGNLTDVLSPESTEIEDIFSYHYVYDNRNRLRGKTLPNFITTNYGYNDLDLLTAQNDANGYLLIFGYNNYQEKITTYLGGPDVQIAQLIEDNVIDPVNGRLMESTTKRLDNYSDLRTRYRYDALGRLSAAEGVDHTDNQRLTAFAYDGPTDRQAGTYNKGGGETWYELFGFDHGKRLKTTSFSGNITAVNNYNFRDELIEKNMGDFNPAKALQSVDYAYNIRGFLTEINTILPYEDNFVINNCEPNFYVGGDCETAADISIEDLFRIRFTGDELNVNCYSECEIQEPIETCDYQIEWDAYVSVKGIYVDGTKIDLPQDEYEPEIRNSIPYGYPNLKKDFENWLTENNYKFASIALDIDYNKPIGIATLTVLQTDLSLSIIEVVAQPRLIKFTRTNCIVNYPITTEIAAVIRSTVENSSREGSTDPVTLFQVKLSSDESIILTESEITQLSIPVEILGCQVLNSSNEQVRLVVASGIESVPLDNILGGDRKEQIQIEKTCTTVPQSLICPYSHFTEGSSIVWNIFMDGQTPHYQYYDDRTETDEDGLLEITGGTTSKVNRSYAGIGEFIIDLDVRPDMVEGREAISTEFTFSFYSTGRSPSEIGLHDGTGFIKVNGGQERIVLCQLPFICNNTITLKADESLTADQLLNLKAVGFMSGSLEIYANELNLQLEGPCDPPNCQRPTPICDAEEARRQKEYIEELRRKDPAIEMLNLPMPNALHRVILCNGSELYLWEHELQILYGGYEILQSIEVNDPTDFEFKVFLDDEDSADAFAMRLHYAGPIEPGFEEGTFVPQLSGNIGSIDWQGRGRQTQRYAFGYDRLSRLTSATYIDRQPDGTFDGDNKYGVPGIKYDLNGNIQSLNRRGPIGNCDTEILYGIVDRLDYNQYNGNQLEVLIDQSPEGYGGVKAPQANYAYDDNGNLISDSGKGILEIKYNFLNLPSRIDFGGGNVIEYVYDATGAKLRKIVTTEDVITEIRDYVGGVELVDNELEAIYHSEGRLGPNGMEYTITDHLGNARVSFADLDNNGKITVGGEDSEILQENHYYPFGLKMEGKWAPQIGKENKYGFNGKELDTDFGLNWHHYGFRMYDPAIARFPSADPIAEKFAFVSPYNYAENSPIANIDLHGLQKLSIHLAGKLVINGDSYPAGATATVDMGNQNRFSYGLSIKGLGSYSSSGSKIDLKALGFETDKPKGIVVPGFAAKFGINQAISAMEPNNLKDALALSANEVQLNNSIRALLHNIGDLIDQDLIDVIYSYDGSTGVATDENGNDYDRKFTSIYKGKLDDFTFGDDGISFKGNLIISYTEQRNLTQEKKQKSRRQQKKEDAFFKRLEMELLDRSSKY